MSTVDGVDPGLDVAALFAKHRERLVRLAIMLVDDVPTAEDVVQDAFAGLQQHRGSLRSAASVTAYLRQSVVNNAHRTLRRRRTARRYKWPDANFVAGADVDFGIAETHRRVFEAVRQLPPRQREVLVLRYWLDMSELQIAQMLGISPGGVKSQASRGVRKVKLYLEETS